MGAVSFSIDPALARCLRQALALTTFVETGTFEGEAVARVLSLFDEVHTIELSENYYAMARDRFRSHEAVNLYQGESSEVLASIRPQLEDKPVLYWLDAHWCVASNTAGELSQCPLLNELNAIAELNSESVVLIDDARLFLSPPPYPHEVSHWPRLREVIQKLLSLSSRHEVMVVNDVIVFYPSSITEIVMDYSQSNTIDLLASLRRLEQLEEEREMFSRVLEERAKAIDELTEACDARLQTINLLQEALEQERRSRDG